MFLNSKSETGVSYFLVGVRLIFFLPKSIVLILYLYYRIVRFIQWNVMLIYAGVVRFISFY